jgi:hypothetical protein
MRVRHRRWAALLAAFVLVAGGPARSKADDWSQEYKDSLKRTAELRRLRRRSAVAQPVGEIIPYPMPPVLIIRHTSETHDEIGALLDLLRYGGR